MSIKGLTGVSANQGLYQCTRYDSTLSCTPGHRSFNFPGIHRLSQEMLKELIMLWVIISHMLNMGLDQKKIMSYFSLSEWVDFMSVS